MKTIALIQTFLRSFFLQALWNFERMQNIGFAFSIEPLLKRAHRSREAFTRSLRRHCEYFNVHPYFAPIVMGVIYNKEKSLSESKRVRRSDADRPQKYDGRSLRGCRRSRYLGNLAAILRCHGA